MRTGRGGGLGEYRVHATHDEQRWVEKCHTAAVRTRFFRHDENTPVSVHGAWEDRTMLALFNWTKGKAASTRDHWATLDSATIMSGPILIQMRLESVPGNDH
jgi:hypothetical protein